MRFFALLNLQHIILYVFPTLIFIIIFGLALGNTYFKTADHTEKLSEIHGRYPDNLEDKNAPFPAALMLIIAGTIAWAVFYTLGTGLLGVKI